MAFASAPPLCVRTHTQTHMGKLIHKDMRDTHRHTCTCAHTDIETQRQRDTHRHTYTQILMHKNMHTHRHTNRHADTLM